MSTTVDRVLKLEHRFFALGKKVHELYDQQKNPDLFHEKNTFDEEFLEKMTDAFNDWDEDNIVSVLEEYIQLDKNPQKKRLSFSIRQLSKWVKSHKNDPISVINCMRANPPAHYEIWKQLPQTGKQKFVFYAYEQYSQTDKILKKVIEGKEEIKQIISNELQSATLKHSNIIETNFKQNQENETFFIEDVLNVLEDASHAEGIIGTINLLYDIGSALEHLHSKNRVHLDIKPDNIGLREGSYILLDFGACRFINHIEEGKDYATGSFRTRAPELFETGQYKDPRKADVYALGATAYRLLLGHYPLLKDQEKQFRDDNHKNELTEIVKERIKDYDNYVFAEFEKLDADLASILRKMLAKNPSNRPTPTELLEILSSTYSSHIKKNGQNVKLTAIEEFDQISKAIDCNVESIKLIPMLERESLKTKLVGIAKSVLNKKERSHQLEARIWEFLDLFGITDKEIIE